VFIKRAYQNIFNFSGKTGRQDFWLWTLLVSWPLVFNLWWPWQLFHNALWFVVSIGILLPSISIMVRRLRDAGFAPTSVVLIWASLALERYTFSIQSGYSNLGAWLFSALLLLIVTIVFLILWSFPSKNK
jgi:uncharacterized membrane protein YhaH (DUF805 family)